MKHQFNPSASSVYNLLMTTPFDVVLQAFKEKTVVVTDPNEIVDGVSLFEGVLSHFEGLFDRVQVYSSKDELRTEYHIKQRKSWEAILQGSHPGKTNLSALQEILFHLIEIGAKPWQDKKLFAHILVSPFEPLVDYCFEQILKEGVIKEYKQLKVSGLDIDGWMHQLTWQTKIEQLPQMPLHHALTSWNDLASVEKLIEHGWPINQTLEDGRTPLFFCRRPELVKTWVEAEANADIRAKDGSTASSLWGQRAYTVQELKDLRDQLPAIQVKRGQTDERDVKSFIESMLSMKKTKMLTERRRIHLSVDQIIDDESVSEKIVAQLFRHPIQTLGASEYHAIKEDKTYQELWDWALSSKVFKEKPEWIERLKQISQTLSRLDESPTIKQMSYSSPSSKIIKREELKEIFQGWLEAFKELSLPSSITLEQAQQEITGLQKALSLTLSRQWLYHGHQNSLSAWFTSTSAESCWLDECLSILNDSSWIKAYQNIHPGLTWNGVGLILQDQSDVLLEYQDKYVLNSKHPWWAKTESLCLMIQSLNQATLEKYTYTQKNIVNFWSHQIQQHLQVVNPTWSPEDLNKIWPLWETSLKTIESLEGSPLASWMERQRLKGLAIGDHTESLRKATKVRRL